MQVLSVFVSRVVQTKFFRNKNALGSTLINLYDAVHLALWAMLFAGLAMFVFVALPDMPRLQAEAQARRVLEINAEHDGYCRKWGMERGSDRYQACVLDLQQLRVSIERRIADEISF